MSYRTYSPGEGGHREGPPNPCSPLPLYPVAGFLVATSEGMALVLAVRNRDEFALAAQNGTERHSLCTSRIATQVNVSIPCYLR